MSDYTPVYARRRMTAATLFLNKQGKLLIVKPTYRDDDGSLVPGGVIDDNESPLEGNKREIREELGMDLAVQHLLCAEYQSAQETKTAECALCLLRRTAEPATDPADPIARW